MHRHQEVEIAAQPSQRQRRGSRLAEWTLIISISFVILSLSILEPLARSSVQNHDSKFILPQKNDSVEGGTHGFASNETGGGETASSSCTFCEILNEPELVVPQAGGKSTCRSIQLMAASEINGSDICATLQKEEKICCPEVYE